MAFRSQFTLVYGDYEVTEYGNGAAVHVLHIPSGRDFYLQDENAGVLSDALEETEDAQSTLNYWFGLYV